MESVQQESQCNGNGSDNSSDEQIRLNSFYVLERYFGDKDDKAADKGNGGRGCSLSISIVLVSWHPYGEEFAKMKNVRNEVKFIRDELTGMKDALEGLSDLDELDTQTKRNIGFVTKIVQRLKTLMARHRVAGQIEEVKKLVLETMARRKRYKLDIPLLSNVVAIDPRVKTLYQKVVNLLLKYLWIGKHCSYQLPIQIGVLEHLETLVLPSCDSLPSDIVGLPRLIHLDVETGLPDGVDKMKSLRHLCTFHLEKNSLDNIKGLGELTNLRYLILKCNGRLDNRGRRLDVLGSSLGNLGSLEDLLVYLPGCIDGLMPLLTSPHPTPYRLERLVLLPDGWVTRVPSWMGQLRHLCELECEVGELQTDGVGVLADLPVLGCP
ncbi:putative disease resistance RPP8-like protein 4 [Hordeum vulgare]|nr:putative disease resistance RPP8-like protein 4 [Hordeum vulgare]